MEYEKWFLKIQSLKATRFARDLRCDIFSLSSVGASFSSPLRNQSLESNFVPPRLIFQGEEINMDQQQQQQPQQSDFVTFEVLLVLIFVIGTSLNLILVLVFIRRRSFRSHLSNR